MRKQTIQYTLALFMCMASVSSCANADQPLLFGVVPQQAPSELAKAWAPLIKVLEEKTGLTLLFKTAPDIPEFERRLQAGEFDLAYMNPYHYVTFHETAGYRAVAREKKKKLTGIVVVRKEDPIASVAELNGVDMAFPAPASFAATVLPLASFQQMNVTVTPHYVRSHDSVYRSVVAGIYPAGGGIMRTFNNVPDEIKDKLRILWTTKSFTPHAIAAHPRVSQAVADKLVTALAAMSEDAAGKAILEALDFGSFESADDKDWNDVRALNIGVLSPKGAK